GDSAQPRATVTRKPGVTTLPLATPAPYLAVETAVRRFALLVDGAEATHDIDDDVALDLKQVLRNAVAAGQGVTEVRTKLEVRYGEGRLPLLLKQELHHALDGVEAALARSTGT
ncbi:hypothetical protein, partial [Microbispora triticiradicis]